MLPKQILAFTDQALELDMQGMEATILQKEMKNN